MKQRVVAFVPAKAVSRRLANKNYRDFAGIKGGLLQLKLLELKTQESIDDIVLYTNIHPKNYDAPEGVIVCDRNDDPDITTKQLHKDAAAVLRNLGYEDWDIVVWAQVTSPLFVRYDEAVSKFKWANTFSGAMSLLGVTPIQSFFVDSTCNPVNYEWSLDKGYWPRTQTMREVYEINSSVSVLKLKTLEDFGDRIVRPVEFLKTSKAEGVDVDDLEDFKRAEYEYRRLQGQA